MKPPAYSITLTLHRPGGGWYYMVRRFGEPIACSDGDGEGHEYALWALKAAFEDANKVITVKDAPK
jgi:hypothetical protein